MVVVVVMLRVCIVVVMVSFMVVLMVMGVSMAVPLVMVLMTVCMVVMVNRGEYSPLSLKVPVNRLNNNDDITYRYLIKIDDLHIIVYYY